VNYNFEDLDNFSKGSWSPAVMLTSNVSKNVSIFAEYGKNISNRSLKIRDTFESQISTNEIVAKRINPEVYSQKVAKKETAAPAPAPAISTPTISMANQTVYDNGGASAIIGTPTVTNVVTGAIYTFTSNPFGSMLTINSSTGQMTWYGDLFGDQTETITVKVTNPDTGTANASFSLTVINNG
jgi:hypothetical protein